MKWVLLYNQKRGNPKVFHITDEEKILKEQIKTEVVNYSFSFYNKDVIMNECVPRVVLSIDIILHRSNN